MKIKLKLNLNQLESISQDAMKLFNDSVILIESNPMNIQLKSPKK